MKLHIGLACGLGLMAGVFALPGYARGIGVDEGSSCSIEVPQPVSLAAGSASPGLGGNAYGDCTVDATAGLSPGVSGDYTYNLWNWVAGPPASILGQPLSNLDNLGQVAEFQLTSGTYAGDTEVQFNYPDYSPGSTSCAEASATLTWGGTKYTFTGAGAGGAGLCGVTDDFLFSLDAADNWVVSGVDLTGAVDAGPPAGWSIAAANAVPEPDTLMLLACAAVPMIIALRARARARIAVTGRGGSPRR
jgi:hypothetical protein